MTRNVLHITPKQFYMIGESLKNFHCLFTVLPPSVSINGVSAGLFLILAFGCCIDETKIY